MKNFNTILTKNQRKYQHCHQHEYEYLAGKEILPSD